jgi:FkbH-like protein
MSLPPAAAEAAERYRDVRDLRSLQKALRAFDAAATRWRGGAPDLLPCRIWIASNYSTQFLAAALRPALAVRGIWADIAEAGYNQWELALLDPRHPIHATRPDLVLLLLSSQELAFRGDSGPEAVAGRIAAVAEAVKRHGGGRLLLSLPEPLEEERSSASWAYDWRRRLDAELRTRLQSTGTILLDLDPLIRSVGARGWFSEKYYIAAKLPFHPDHTHRLANHLADAVRGALASPCKLLVTDLDNTLWGGVVGDLGWEQVDLDAGGKGHAHLRLQRFLRHLCDRGILLAIASKNDPGVALEVFRRRTEMLLREEDFSAVEIHWGPKSASIQRILRRLNLSTAGVLFLDDSPVERAEVRRALPDVIVPDLPADPAGWVPILLETGLFEGGPSTAESSHRSRYYEEERVRQAALEASPDLEGFLADLRMVLRPEAIDRHRERVVELINKTNQFNLTSRRFGWSRIEEVLAGGGRGFSFRLEDRFGDYGLIAVVLLAARGEGRYLIDTWVMSCRVMGRTVERAILSYIITALSREGGTRLIGEYIPSDKNGPVASLYASLGFEGLASEGTSTLSQLPVDPKGAARLNPHIRIAVPTAADSRSAP